MDQRTKEDRALEDDLEEKPAPHPDRFYAWQIREMGSSLPPSIPDCAWVPKCSIQMKLDKIEMEGDITRIKTVWEFSVPFEWCETITEEKEEA